MSGVLASDHNYRIPNGFKGDEDVEDAAMSAQDDAYPNLKALDQAGRDLEKWGEPLPEDLEEQVLASQIQSYAVQIACSLLGNGGADLMKAGHIAKFAVTLATEIAVRGSEAAHAIVTGEEDDHDEAS